ACNPTRKQPRHAREPSPATHKTDSNHNPNQYQSEFAPGVPRHQSRVSTIHRAHADDAKRWFPRPKLSGDPPAGPAAPTGSLHNAGPPAEHDSRPPAG